MAEKTKTSPTPTQQEAQPPQPLALRQTYPMLAQDPAQIQTMIERNMGAAGLGEFDLDRIKVPTGGGIAWTLQGADGKKTATETLEGIVIYWTSPRAYWQVPFERSGGGTPPDCASTDGIMGLGNPGGLCAQCPMNAWGSDSKGGRGKACREGRRLFLLMPGGFLPKIVVVPPTSLKNFQQYMRNLAGNGLFYHDVVTRLSLVQDKSKAHNVLDPTTNQQRSMGGGIEYSKIAFQQTTVLNPDEKKHAYNLCMALTPAMSKVKVTDEDTNGGF